MTCKSFGQSIVTTAAFLALAFIVVILLPVAVVQATGKPAWLAWLINRLEPRE